MLPLYYSSATTVCATTLALLQYLLVSHYLTAGKATTLQPIFSPSVPTRSTLYSSYVVALLPVRYWSTTNILFFAPDELCYHSASTLPLVYQHYYAIHLLFMLSPPFGAYSSFKWGEYTFKGSDKINSTHYYHVDCDITMMSLHSTTARIQLSYLKTTPLPTHNNLP